MTTPTTILRDSALVLPLLVGVGAWLDGLWGAVAVAVSGLVALLNLAALAFVVRRLVAATTAGRGAGGAVLLILGKMVVVLAVYWGLLMAFEPLSVAIGLISVIFGLAIRGAIDALHLPDTLPVEEP